MKKKSSVAIGLVVLCFMMMTAGAAWSGVFPNGTVTDGNLVWLKNASCFSEQNENASRISAYNLQSGKCGLTDGSKAGDWRIPTIEELTKWYAIKHKFTGVQQGYYWSTTYDDKCDALVINKSGKAQNCINDAYVMPVRAIK